MTEPRSVYITEWISFDEAKNRKLPESLGGLGGYFEFGMRWKDYWEPGQEPPHLIALRDSILKRGIREGGDWHQEEGVPVFSDGTHASFSYRAWADLLAAIWSENDNLDYRYTDFYMSPGCTREQALSRGRAN